MLGVDLAARSVSGRAFSSCPAYLQSHSPLSEDRVALKETMRRFVAERNMLAAALVLDTLAALAAIMIGGELAGVVLAGTVNLSAAIGRLAFESIVQRDGPETGRGQTFARYETRFQFGWVVGATLPVLLSVSGTAGFVYLAAVAGVAAVAYVYD